MVPPEPPVFARSLPRGRREPHRSACGYTDRSPVGGRATYRVTLAMATTRQKEQRMALDPLDFLGLDALLGDEERMIRDTVRTWVRERVLPGIEGWFDRGEFPVDVAKELAGLGLLGMHLSGYGCAGTNSVSYGLTCLELEAGDSGFRSFVSVQGSLAMYPIWAFGSEEQKKEWLPRMATGEVIGCFGLTEPDFGSDPARMRTAARKDGSDWILSGTKMWITNGSVADVAVVWARTEDGVRGFLVPGGTPGFTTQDIHQKLSLRAPLSCLSEARFGIVFGAVGAARACYEAALDYSITREQFGKPIGGFQLTQAKLAQMLLKVNQGTLLALHLGRMKDGGTLQPEHVSFGKLANVNAALEVAREARQVL